MPQYLDQAVMNAYNDLTLACQQPAFNGTGLSFVKKRVKGVTYMYTCTKVGRVPVQRYLGPDNEDTRALIEQEKALWERNRTGTTTRARLVDMVLSGGMRGLPPQEGKILRMLERSGLFLSGGVLVGTPAFNALGCSMGVIWDNQFETRDVDIAVDNPLLPLVTGNPDLDLVQAIKDAGMGFVSIPMLNPKKPSTSFKMAGGDYIVELLTPERGKPSKGPIRIAALNAVAEPLRFLDYLLEGVQSVALPFGVGILVNVPDPARFSLHKLVVSQRRPAAFAAKSKKDIDQARQMLEHLADIRPGAIESAREAAEEMGSKFLKQLRLGGQGLPDHLKAWL